MNHDAFVGVDIGTTSVKAGLFDAGGVLLDRVQESYLTHRAGNGVVEQDPADWWRLVDAALQRFAAGQHASRVAGIGITSQANTHLFVDAAGIPLAPALVWQDSRATAEAQALDISVEHADRLAWWGAPMPIDASHALSRMRWMQEHRPDTWKDTRYVLLPKDWILYQLAGRFVSDPLSNIGLVDLDAHYVDALVDRVDGAALRLAPLADPVSLAGQVRAGMPFAGVPVAVGTMDAWAGVFGSGSLSEGSGLYLSGTSEIIGLMSQRVVPRPGVLVMPEMHGMRLHVGPTQSGGAAQLWFCDLFSTTPEGMASAAATVQPDDRSPLFLPHLQGERAPLWDARARGTFLGMDSATDKAALAYAVYEGVACSARLLLDALRESADIQPATLNAGGGGFRSDTWNRIRADMLGLELRRVAVTDPGTLGAAGLAAVAAGHHTSIADAFAALVHIDRTYAPDPAAQDRSQARMQLYRDAIEATRNISHRLC